MDSHLGIADSILCLLIHSLKKGRNHMLFVLYARCARIQHTPAIHTSLCKSSSPSNRSYAFSTSAYLSLYRLK